jgi:proline iminopeptidase
MKKTLTVCIFIVVNFVVNSPLSMQQTLSTILKSLKSIYTNRQDSVNLNYINMLGNIDKSAIQYSSCLFSHAKQNGFYYPKEATKEALHLYKKFKTHTLLLKYSSNHESQYYFI